MLDHLSHQDVRGAKQGDAFEPLFFEHGNGAVRGNISEGRNTAATAHFRFLKVRPVEDRVSLDQASTFFLDRFEGGLQGSAGNSVCAKFFVNDEAGDSPDFAGRGFSGKPEVITAVIDAGQLFLGAVLTPADWLAISVDENSVGVPFVDEEFLFAAIADTSFRAGG